MAALRTGALAALALLFFNPARTERVRGGPPTALARGAKLVLVPRDTIPDAALMDVSVEPRAQRGDSIAGTVLISTVGPLSETTAQLEILEGTRRLALLSVPLPRSPGVARRPFM